MRFDGIFARALEAVVVGLVFLPLVALHGLFCLNAMKLERLVIRMADRLDMRRGAG